MKRSILMLLLISVALIFFGCEKMEPIVPDSGSDLETSSLKAKKVKVIFSGTSNAAEFPDPANVDPGTTIELPNGKTKQTGIVAEWYDQASDPLVTGTTVWYENFIWEGAPFASNAKLWGKTELFVDDPDDPDAPYIGKWDMTWHGYLTLIPDENMLITCYAVGQGKEGVVKGMTAKWTYKFDLLNVGFLYETEGYYK